jgi:flagellar biosynthesis/type III secretory pathway chaperone
MSAGAPTSVSPLEQIELESAGLRALGRLLDAECDALRRVDADAIESAAAAKLAQIDALERLHRARACAMHNAGYPATEAGVRLWIAASGMRATNAFDTLLDLARTTRDANARNHRLMLAQQRHYAAAHAALLGAAGIAPVYGADGRAAHRAPAQRFVAA